MPVFYCALAQRPEWKQYVTGGIRGVGNRLYEVLVGGPRSARHLTLILTPPPSLRLPPALDVMILNEQPRFHPVARHRLG